jgi:hypothetical protein
MRIPDVSLASRSSAAGLRAPQFGVDPLGYVERVVSLLRESRLDLLFPAHDQAYLFARFLDRLFDLTHLALPPFDAFKRRQSKVDFAGVFEELGLPSPPTVVAMRFAEDDQTKRWHATLRGKTCRFETVPDRARRNNGLPDPNGRRLLELLDRPMRGREIAEKLQITRQRVRELLIKLHALGCVNFGDPQAPSWIAMRAGDKTCCYLAMRNVCCRQFRESMQPMLRKYGLRLVCPRSRHERGVPPRKC